MPRFAPVGGASSKPNVVYLSVNLRKKVSSVASSHIPDTLLLGETSRDYVDCAHMQLYACLDLLFLLLLILQAAIVCSASLSFLPPDV